jgi:uncharacterized protein YkwD
VGIRRQAVRYVNQLRADHGLDKLKYDPSFNKATRRHSRQMAQSGDIFHTEGSVLNNQMNKNYGGGNWSLAGENVGRGNVGGLEELLEAFRKSQPHRKNMLTPKYNNISTGFKKAPDGSLYLTYWFNDG